MSLKKSSMKRNPWPRQMEIFLHNTWILFLFFIISACWIMYLACQQDLLSMMVLFLTGFVVYCFSSNMIVVLSISLFFTGIVHFMQLNNSHQMTLGHPLWEGMTDISGSSKDEPVPANTLEHEPIAAPLPSKLVEQVFDKNDGVTTAADLEKLKLQKEILDKVSNMQPLIQNMTKIAGMFGSNP